jgi:hypothetical protein
VRPIEQVTLRELLQDPLFRKWMTKIPRPSPTPFPNGWRVYAKIGGRWRRKEFRTYAEAYRWLMPRLRRFEDAAISSKAQPFKPPIVSRGGVKDFWRPKLDLLGHRWCPYCRRPTVFFTFRKHHAMPANLCASYEPRCTICGIRGSAIKEYVR